MKANEACLVAIDCGTTAVKAGVFDTGGRVLGLHAVPTPCVTANDGAVEHDPLAIEASAWLAVRRAVAEAMVEPSRVAGVAITGQRATVICTDRHGEPLGRAVSWQDMRGAAEIERVRPDFERVDGYAITGLSLHPVFTLGKLIRLRYAEPERLARAERLCLVCGWLARRFGSDGFVEDLSNASLSGLLDIHRLDWSGPMLSLAGIESARLPRLVTSGETIGRLGREAARACGLLAGTPLVAGGGDQQCAGVGAGAIEPGTLECTVGTAAVTLAAAGRPLIDPDRAVACCVHAVPGRWELEGLQTAAGAAVTWFEGVAGGRRLIDEAAGVPPGAAGALFLPYLSGAAAPRWHPDATGSFLGLRLGATAGQLARAVIEGVVFETRSVLDAFNRLGIVPAELRVAGGWAGEPLWQTILADCTGLPVRPLTHPQTTLLGAAMLAAVGVGLHPSPEAAAGAMVAPGEPIWPDGRARPAYDAAYARYLEADRRLAAAGLFGGPARE